MPEEPILRLGIFLALLSAFALWEVFLPRRTLKIKKSQRWLNNFSLMLMNSLVLRICFPLAAVGLALYAQQQQLGLLNQFTTNALVVGIISIIVLDCTIYWQHRLFHNIPLFWRLHKIHHTDLDVDVSSAVRFPPVGNFTVHADQKRGNFSARLTAHSGLVVRDFTIQQRFV